jgi:hypothetical protein
MKSFKLREAGGYTPTYHIYAWENILKGFEAVNQLRLLRCGVAEFRK